ncbi:large ribosomal subunit protein uL24m-like [Corticium candelabrum]|uniref:large ribosomal subunit protein uL24m-like n=1 Tax=Corticium candelabrum TaxID=121492 RepID=UPI002E2732F4|nr:large ribosomal subunit protein uL24m-like [Corticium candelabrum]
MPRPWTATAKRLRTLRGIKRKPPEPIRRWKVVRGDWVEVLVGKDKGKQGKVIDVDRSLNRVFVKGLNTHQRYIPPHGEFKGNYVASEAPLHYSNISLVDPGNMQATKVGYRYLESGEKVRVSKRTGRIIPKPVEASERKDFKTRSGYVEGRKDTKADDVTKRTYTPSLQLFEEEILTKLGPHPPQ